MTTDSGTGDDAAAFPESLSTKRGEAGLAQSWRAFKLSS